MENQNTEAQGTSQQHADNGHQGVDQTGQQERTFTQEEVNRIVGERLARVKGNADYTGFSEREQQLNQRELRLDAREKLADAGIPKELLPLVNCNSKEEMEKSINLIGAYIQKPATGNKETGGVYRVSTGAYSSGSIGGAAGDDIRKAMGLGKR